MSYFYGMSYENVMSLTSDVFEEYYLAITQIEAQERLLDLQVQDYPHGKASFKRGIHKRFYKLAYPQNEEKTMKSEDVAKYLARMLK